MGKTSNGSVTVLLSCTHRFAFSILPRRGEQIWCPRCDMPRRVLVVREYYAKCKECRYGRLFGANKQMAEAAGTRHYHKSGHTVKVGLQGKTAVTIGDDGATQSSLEI